MEAASQGSFSFGGADFLVSIEHLGEGILILTILG